MSKVVVKLIGGLGNQMFQYGAAKLYAQATGKNLELFTRDLLDHSADAVKRNYDLEIFQNIDCKFTDDQPDQVIRSYQQMRDIPGDVYFDGYFQTTEVLWQSVLDDFFLGDCVSEKAKNLEKQISPKDLCINIRRGDYVSRPGANNFHGFLDQKYIDHAIKYFKEIEKVYVFSDEVEWCKNNIKLECPTIYVGHDHAGPKFSDYLRLMSKFDKIIIPNSTFAWWAAVFSQYRNNQSKIVSPAPCLWYVNNFNLAAPLLNTNWTKVQRKDLE